MERFDFYIERREDLIDAVRRFGFVPLFRNRIRGFSVEEHVSPKVWFSAEDGVWEWKGPVIREASCAYGKLFGHKAVFADAALYAELANCRRDGYDFDARFEDGLASFREKELFELIDGNAPVISKELKRLGGYGKEGKKGFDALLDRLQAQCYVLTSDFVYETDRHGRPYGWGVAEYSTPERFFGGGFAARAYRRKPSESYELLLCHLADILPDAPRAELEKLLKN